MQSNNKVAVIGAGIIGINCAIELQQRGYQVTLLDKTGIGQACSKGNAGHFATEQVFPMADAKLLTQLPKMLLDPLGPISLSIKYLPKSLPWFMQFLANMFNKQRLSNTKALRSLNERALAYYQPLLQAANAQHLFSQNGSLLVFEHTELTQITAIQQSYLAQNVKVSLLTREQALMLEPNLSPNIRYALHFTDVGHTINPLVLSQCLANYALSLGCQFQQFDVNDIIHHSNYVAVSDKQHTHKFDQIVIATGAWSTSILAKLGYKLPLIAERGYSLDLNAQTLNKLSRPVASAERRFIITPMSHGLRLSGTAEFASLSQKPNMRRATMLLQHAQHIIQGLSSPTQPNENAWMGCRPSLPDSLPVIGKAPKHHNISLALGHQHLGLTLGAITGKLIGQIVSGQQTDVDITPFCLTRFNKSLR
nr:FAD-dependent oxidoreductase [Thalassotalea sp. G2M2-11]